MAIYYGNNVTTKYSGTNYTWKNLTEYTYTDNGNTFTVNIKVKFFLDASATSQLRFSKGNFYATLTINGTQEASFSNSPEYTIHGGLDNAWEVINFSKTYTKTASAQTFSVTTTAEAKSPSTWKGVSTVPVGTFTIDVPALSTMTVTATNGNATYNGSAHYAKIKVNVAGTTVEYGTSTSYGNSLTATNANTDYTLSSVSATNVADSKTVYYRVTKAGYVTVTGSTTITISKAANPMTYAAQSWAPTFSTGAQTKTLNAAASAQGTVTYSLQSQKQGSTTVNYFSFNTSTRVLTMAANTPVNTYTVVVRAAAAGNGNYNSKNVDSTITVTVGKATNPLAYTATQSYSKTFSTAAQTQATTAATGAQGTLSYAINSQKSGSTTVSHFSLSTTTLTVAANTPAGTYTVVIRATAAGNGNYNSGTKDSTITFTINKATPTLSVTGATLHYTGSAQTLVSASSVTGGGTIYYGLGSSSSSAPSSWSTTKPTATNVGTYYIWAKSDASTNYNAVAQVYKASATIKPVMWLKYHANGGTIADAPHKNSDTVYFKLNNSLVQIGSSATGTFSDYVLTIDTSTTYSNFYNVSTFNITRTGYSIKSGTAAYNTAANGTGIDVNQDNTAAGDTNPVTTKRLNGGTEITANVTKTLYVNWKANTYTVTLNANNGSGGTASVTATYDSAMPSATMPTRTGYTFQGYYDTSAATGGTQYYTSSGASARTWNKTAATTLYARWTINSYTLTIDPNGGSWNNSTAVSTASQNYATTKSIAAPTRTGYTFVGWAETGPGHLSKINNTDPSFDSSNGGVGVYNNSGGGTVTHTRQSSSAGATYGSYEILINASSGTTSPGNGGFYQNTQSAANQKYVHVFVAKIPVGYTAQQACNATGDGRSIYWLTSRKGTGGYQVYAYQHNCGSTGSFSTFGHVYLDTGSRPVSWQLAYSAMTNITNGFADTYTYGAGAGRLTALWAPIVPVHVNVNGTWKTGPVWLNINGTWKQALEGYVNVNGAWKQFK